MDHKKIKSYQELHKEKSKWQLQRALAATESHSQSLKTCSLVLCSNIAPHVAGSL